MRPLATLGRVGRSTAGVLVTAALLLAAWLLALAWLPSNIFLARPEAVAAFLVSGEAGELYRALGESLGFIAIGYLIGISLAVVTACLLVSGDRLARLLMPLVVVVGGLPIIVIVPIMRIVLGRGLTITLVVCVIVTFFPCTLAVVSGLRSPSAPTVDLLRSWGVGPWRTMLTLRLPSAVPALISASRFALPAALTGVILTESIATARGLGLYLALARSHYQYVDLWAGIVVTLLASLLIYSLLAALEARLSRRFDPAWDNAGR